MWDETSSSLSLMFNYLGLFLVFSIRIFVKKKYHKDSKISCECFNDEKVKLL